MRETSEVAKGVARMIRALGKRVAQEDPGDLMLIRGLVRDVDSALTEAVEGLRQGGHTDKAIGDVLGMTRQAVQQRWPHTERVVGAGARYRRK